MNTATVGKIIPVTVEVGQAWKSDLNDKSWRVVNIIPDDRGTHYWKVLCEYLEGNPKNTHPGQRFTWSMSEFYLKAGFAKTWKLIQGEICEKL